MTITLNQLVGYQRAELDRAAKLEQWYGRVQMLIAIAGIASAFIKSDRATYSLTIAAFLLGALWVFIWIKYRESRFQGDRARRATLIIGGLGTSISDSTLRDLCSKFTVSVEKAAKHEDLIYFASNKDPGPARLTEMLEESCFHSTNLMRIAAKNYLFWSIIPVIATIVVFLALVPIMQVEETLRGSKVVLGILTLLASADILGSALTFHSAAGRLDTLMPRFDAVRNDKYPQPDLYLLMSDYSAIVESAPVIDPSIYQRNRDRLNKLWDQHRRAD